MVREESKNSGKFFLHYSPYFLGLDTHFGQCWRRSVMNFFPFTTLLHHSQMTPHSGRFLEWWSGGSWRKKFTTLLFITIKNCFFPLLTVMNEESREEKIHHSHLHHYQKLMYEQPKFGHFFPPFLYDFARCWDIFESIVFLRCNCFMESKSEEIKLD